VRPLVTGATPPSAADVPRRAAELVAAQFDTVAAAAEGCDALVATGLMPAGARSVAEKLGIRYVYASYQPVTLPSPHHPPQARPGRPFPPDVTDDRVLWDLDAQSGNALFGAALNTHRASIGLPPVDNVHDHVFTDQPWLAADPTLGPWQEPTDLDVVQTGAWILPDVRPLPADLVAFLDAGKCRNRTRSLVVRATLTKRWASSGSNGRTNTSGWRPTSTTSNGQAWTITSSPSTRHDYNANVP
jgi:vancomycin aglycone glucosyltransferase